MYQEHVAGPALALAPGKLFGSTDARGGSCFHASVNAAGAGIFNSLWQGSGAQQDVGSLQTLSSLYIMLAISSSPARRPACVYPGDLAEMLWHR